MQFSRVNLSVLTCGLFALMTTAKASGDTITVCWDGSGDHTTIQAGIDAASPGDEVVVCDGTYTGSGNKDLDFDDKTITVRSENGPENCIIDCQGNGRGFYFFVHDGAIEATVIDGFTITNGSASLGGGIYCLLANLTIANCHITGNTGSGMGGGVYLEDSSATILNCSITGNSAGTAGGILCYDVEFSPPSDVTIIGCAIQGNTAVYGGGVYCFRNDPKISNCAITGNTADEYGGGVVCFKAGSPVLTNCTVAFNTADVGGGVYCWAEGNPPITNGILWENTPEQIWHSTGSNPDVNYSDVMGGWAGNGNLNTDPLFVDPDGPDDDAGSWEDNDYRLASGSPCIDAGDNRAVPPDTLDLDGDGDTTEPIPFDLDGNLRFVDDPCTADTGEADPRYPQLPIVDMGPYEYRLLDPDVDGDVDANDFAGFQACFKGEGRGPVSSGCRRFDTDCDEDVDLADYANFWFGLTGPQ